MGSLNHLADLGVSEEITDLELVGPLDDKGFVKVRIAHLDVLHAQELTQFTEVAFAVDGEPEALRVDVRGTQSCHQALPVLVRPAHVQGHGPGTDMSLDLTARTRQEAALDELSPDFLAELPPHFVFAGTKPAHLLGSWVNLSQGVFA
jgi:hypothetical protein